MSSTNSQARKIQGTKKHQDEVKEMLKSTHYGGTFTVDGITYQANESYPGAGDKIAEEF